MRAIQPLTGLPGNTSIDKELERRVADGEPFALMHADLNNFKAYNDHYGYARGDDVLIAFAEVLVQAAREFGGPETFVGHVGGDDFVIVTDPELVDPHGDAPCASASTPSSPSSTTSPTARAGQIVVKDRQGDEQVYPLVRRLDRRGACPRTAGSNAPSRP